VLFFFCSVFKRDFVVLSTLQCHVGTWLRSGWRFATVSTSQWSQHIYYIPWSIVMKFLVLRVGSLATYKKKHECSSDLKLWFLNQLNCWNVRGMKYETWNHCKCFLLMPKPATVPLYSPSPGWPSDIENCYDYSVWTEFVASNCVNELHTSLEICLEQATFWVTVDAIFLHLLVWTCHTKIKVLYMKHIDRHDLSIMLPHLNTECQKAWNCILITRYKLYIRCSS
jgi:hypothetical protein